MDLSQLIVSSVQKARTQAGNLIIGFTVKKKTGTSYFNGRNVVDYSPKPVEGLYDKFDIHEIDGSLIKLTDNRIMLFIDTVDQVPTNEDLLLDGSDTYQVVDCQPIYAGTKIVLAMVHVRK